MSLLGKIVNAYIDAWIFVIEHLVDWWVFFRWTSRKALFTILIFCVILTLVILRCV